MNTLPAHLSPGLPDKYSALPTLQVGFAQTVTITSLVRQEVPEIFRGPGLHRRHVVVLVTGNLFLRKVVLIHHPFILVVCRSAHHQGHAVRSVMQGACQLVSSYA